MSRVTLWETEDGSKGRIVRLDDEDVGYILCPQHGPGYFLYLDGITWTNAPGARFTADSGGGAEATYVRTLKTAIDKATEALRAEGKL